MPKHSLVRQSVGKRGIASDINATESAVSETVRPASKCVERHSAARTTSACQGAIEGPATLASWRSKCDVPVAQQRLGCHAGERKQLDLLDVENRAQRHPIVTMRDEHRILVIQVGCATKSLSQPLTMNPGPCPGCKYPCAKDLSCGHTCKVPCHDNVTIKVEETSKPAGPWEERGPKILVRALECPPCEAPVPVTCLGSHETSDWPCHASKPAPCGRECGRSLPCGNHSCSRDCHKVRNAPDTIVAGSNCRKCELECQVERSPACPHPCPLPCHPPPCKPCTNVIKLRCHCGLANLLRKCGEYLIAIGEEKKEMLCCTDQCPKTLECSHR